MSSTQRLNERQQRMLALLEQTGDVRVPDLKAQFGVTEMTIRRDLEKLEQTGKVKRTFGGAIMVTRDVAFSDRTGVHTAEKAKIGKIAAESVQPGDAVFIDGGTTTLQLVRHLPPEMRITVVTNAINLAAELMDKKIPTLVSGGMLLDTTSTLIGPVCADTLSKMAFDRIFLGATGITPLHGFSNSNMYEAEIKRVAIARAKEINIVADRSKWGMQDLFSFAELSRADRLFTDTMDERTGEVRQALEEAAVEWIVCE
ncbi:DeoR/GlpR family DNA-binding transcription regulator [Cohnella nanjingensis]|uniref:DeoR/GlpR transcriptional regulator n=1 Tax=Cohnella nanjingensis TaxID=1387779 RepID=A0A7X0VEQ4_9BACL|nr:DeoR/GlpR family DNA-binding transcription regulator [Cohnella nanjingensis]MBB6670493.1 DeoR/GlpR transcriptional regulator [Cohnella nanjingensis]